MKAKLCAVFKPVQYQAALRSWISGCKLGISPGGPAPPLLEYLLYNWH